LCAICTVLVVLLSSFRYVFGMDCAKTPVLWIEMDNNKKKAVNNPMETGARGRTLCVPEIVESSPPPPARQTGCMCVGQVTQFEAHVCKFMWCWWDRCERLKLYSALYNSITCWTDHLLVWQRFRFSHHGLVIAPTPRMTQLTYTNYRMTI